MYYKNKFSCTETLKQKIVSVQLLFRLTDQQCISYCTEVGQLGSHMRGGGKKYHYSTANFPHEAAIFPIHFEIWLGIEFSL